MQVYKKDPIKLELLNKSKKIFIGVCNNIVANEDIRFIDVLGSTPLGWAAILGKYELVLDLIRRGADTNIRVFPFLFQVMKIDWILDPALTIITKLLPSKLKAYLNKDVILKIFKTMKEHNYINSDGIYIKYIVNILLEVNKYQCFSKSMIERWKTQEDFNRKIRLSFWLYPKIVDNNNYFIHKFYKDEIISQQLRLHLLNKYINNPYESYKKISELIPLNRNGMDPFLNDAWQKIIIPEMVHNMILRIICEDKIN